MPLTTTAAMLADAQRGGYAVCAFNIENMEMAQAAVWAAQAAAAPVILQTTPATVKYAGLSWFTALASAAAKDATVPVALHLDHGDAFELTCRAVKAGYTSVMIDGSRLPFDENIALTRQVAAVCKADGIPVEAELGSVGGMEDDLYTASDYGYTDPQDAVEFVQATGADSLAVGIGTVHGFYTNEPALDFDRLARIKAVVPVPLVLHGATGLPDEIIKDCVRLGVNKLNFATALRAAFTDAVRHTLNNSADIVDVKVFGRAGREAVMALARKKIALSGSEGSVRYA